MIVVCQEPIGFKSFWVLPVPRVVVQACSIYPHESSLGHRDYYFMPLGSRRRQSCVLGNGLGNESDRRNMSHSLVVGARRRVGVLASLLSRHHP